MNKVSWLLFAGLILIFGGCGENPVQVSGGSSDHGNALRGTVINQDNLPAANVLVAVYEKKYRAVPNRFFAESTFTDSHGVFTFDSLDAELYNILAWDSLNNEALFVPGLQVHDDHTVDLGTRQLEATIYLSGTVYQDSLQQQPIEGGIIICLEGTPFYADINDNGKYAFNHVPAWKYTSAFIAAKAPGIYTSSLDTLNFSRVYASEVESTLQADTLKINFHF